MNAPVATIAIRPGQEIDEERLSSYLRKVPGLGSTFKVRQFSGGQSNPTYLIQAVDKRYVLRKKPPGNLLPSAHQVEREYRIAKALGTTDVPVPSVLHLCEDASVIGTPFFLMEYCDGRIFRDSTLKESSPDERHAIYGGMAETLAKLHRADWKTLGLSDYGKPADYVRRQIQRWSRQFDSSKTHDIPAMDRLTAWLGDHIPAEEEITIAHGDYRLENLVFDIRAPKVIAILDWELSTLGHPLADLAYNCMPYSLPSSMKALGGIADLDIASLGIPSEQEYVQTYCQHVNRDEIPDWTFFKAFALFRTTAILQGVYSRAHQNNAASADAHSVGALAGSVAEIGWGIASH